MTGFHLAQFNVATLRAPVDAPQSTEFREALDHINALAEAHPGFVWRPTGEGFDSETPAPGTDPLYLLNLSIWESAEALAAFAYRTDHREYVRRRAEWFHPHAGPSFVLWWVPAGTIPTEDEAKARLAEFAAQGPSDQAFDFGTRVPPPSQLVSARDAG